jgi:MFS transporter, PPP family, 3-phenylpropionic acid transporter
VTVSQGAVSAAASSLGSFVLLYALLYSAFGAASPFLPALVEARGVPPEQIGLLFAAGTAIRLLADAVPRELAATAQAIYGTVGIGAASALLTLFSGYLYAGLGANAFLFMSLLCLTALPLTVSLRP